jgi:threonine dehydrogenase-like Zn-dependent dehydrogenase
MQALYLSGDSVEHRRDYETPTPNEGEVLVKVVRAGVCETDLQLMQGYMGFAGVLGHEFVGVAQSGPLKGQRVVGEINCSCGKCDTCRSGLPTHCPDRSVIGIMNHDGAFADYVRVPQKNLHAVPDELPTDHAVFVEPVAAAYQILRQQLVSRRDRVLILGDGRLGNLCAQVLSKVVGKVLVVGKHDSKMQILNDLGIRTVHLDDTALHDTALHDAALHDAALQRDWDVVVDCTGSATGLPTALKFVKPWGTVILKTTVAGEQTMALAPIVIDEIKVIGSRCGPFPDAIAGLTSGAVQVEPLISGRFALCDGVAALDHTANEPVLKILLDV